MDHLVNRVVLAGATIFLASGAMKACRRRSLRLLMQREARRSCFPIASILSAAAAALSG